VYRPDPAAVGQYLEDMAIECVRDGWEVTVYTSNRGYDDPAQRFVDREVLRGVEVVRFGLTSFGKGRLLWRLFGQGVFVGRCLLRALFREPRGTRLVISTSPPFVGMAALALKWLRGFPFGWWVMDINPDQLVESGMISCRHPLVRIFDRLNQATLRHADSVVTLDDDMAARLLAKGADPEKLKVIPLWASYGLAPPHQSQGGTTSSPAVDSLDLQAKLVVLYSGNHSLVHPLDTLLDAALSMRDEKDLAFVFCGGGAAKERVVQFVARHQLEARVKLLPYQSLDELLPLLMVGDVHVVAQGDAMTGCVHPSKFYSALACGKAVLWLGPAKTAAANLIEGEQLGWCVPHGSPEVLVEHLQALLHAPDRVDQLGGMGQRALDVSTTRFSREQLLPKVAKCLALE